MPETPRDPRQLARDILAGRIKIEDLAKERQGTAPTQQRANPQLPDAVPLPRPVAHVPMGASRPQMQPQSTLERPPQRAPQPTPNRTPAKAKPLQVKPVQAVPPPVQRQAATTPQAAQTAAQAYGGAKTATIAATMETALGVQPVKHKHKGGGLAQFMRSKNSLRQAIILSEVLNKPLSMRDAE
jgi:hypothetical protein